jgi:hypothetical protein
MCNAWNHSLSCRCGWGGEGHLGRSHGSTLSVVNHSFFTLNRTARNGGHLTSFVNPNARCPVCGDQVFFYQSPEGGRVFFDELGHPWPKHPCTDNGRPAAHRAGIQLIGDENNNLAIHLIHKWEDEGFFPLVCSRTKGYKQIAGEFVYAGSADTGELGGHVWLYLKHPIKVADNALFFLKEIDAARGTYSVRFCYRNPRDNAVLTETIDGRITNFIRPRLRNKKVSFEDFTGLPITPSFVGDTRGKLKVKKQEPQNKTSEVRTCDLCSGEFPSFGFRKNHRRACSNTVVPCGGCERSFPRHSLITHQLQCKGIQWKTATH